MEPTRPGRLQGVHVLLVEDNEDARDILESYLRHHGAMVTSAANGHDALAVLRQVTPHVIVSDLTMPGMTGLDLLRQVRELPGQRERKTPALAVTAHPSPHRRQEALDAGFDAFLVKPVDPLLVVSYVGTLCQQAALARDGRDIVSPGSHDRA
jgi:CheY-like chemotaxis protein